ncbi:MAG: hypothetical protein M3T55_09975 [Pseudomonadota bacterium]|nr:hypothetical protein [Pseudomonadota bacterium]
MTDTPTPAKNDGSQPGVMGDGTEEQNLGQRGNPAARITEDEVREAFGKKPDKAPPKP